MPEALIPSTRRLLAWLAVLGVAAALLLATIQSRGAEYDEQYTVLLASGTPRPVWPDAAFTAADLARRQTGPASAAGIAHDLRTNDVHPPLYFWAAAAWRAATGPGLERLRLLSALFSLGALIALGRIARAARIPPAPAMLFTIGCYGFAYTGAIARGFALAQLLILAGIALLLRAERRRQPWTGFAGGLLLGAASFTNYLAAFAGAAALLWLLLRAPRDSRLWLAAGAGFALFLPADLWFFLAQRASRIGQFTPFDLPHSLALLGRFSAGAVFGGLPLYVEGAGRVALSAALAGVLAVLSVLVAWRWRGAARPDTRWLLVMAAAATPTGLLLLGALFDTTPIELRYLAFSTPFLALLLAGSLASLPRRLAAPIGAVVLAIQAASLTGMLTRAETMQPARAAATAAAALARAEPRAQGSAHGQDFAAAVLVPRGNDGVGVVGAFAAEAPDWLAILVINRDETAGHMRIRAGKYRRAVLALLAQDADSRATAAAMQAAFSRQPCWRRVGSAANVQAYERVCGEE